MFSQCSFLMHFQHGEDDDEDKDEDEDEDGKNLSGEILIKVIK